MTLACEDANSNLVDVVTITDDDRVGNNLLPIWTLRFGQTLSTRFGQDFEVEDLKLELGEDFAADVL